MTFTLKPVIPLGKSLQPAFSFWGGVGVLSALALAFFVGAERGLPFPGMASIAAVSLLVFPILAMVTKIIKGKEDLIYYHHEIAILGAVSLFLTTIGESSLLYLDILIIALGTVLAFGRIGCLSVGCCHGKPQGWGVFYGEEHVESGFTPWLAHIPLFPIQLVESAFVFFSVAIMTFTLLSGAPAGEALSFYVIFYGMARFFFEFARGDGDRPYWLGFSEAQWTTLFLMAFVLGGEFLGLMPFHLWHCGAFVLILLVMLWFSVSGKKERAFERHLNSSLHIEEVARAIKEKEKRRSPTLSTTSLGLNISAGAIEEEERRTHSYTFSADKVGMTPRKAEAVARLLRKLDPLGGTTKILEGRNGVFHFLVHSVK